MGPASAAIDNAFHASLSHCGEFVIRPVAADQLLTKKPAGCLSIIHARRRWPVLGIKLGDRRDGPRYSFSLLGPIMEKTQTRAPNKRRQAPGK
jgi:hypothetical protein